MNIRIFGKKKSFLELKEEWIHQLLLSEHDPRGLFEEGSIVVSLN